MYPNFNIERLNRQKDEIDNLIKSYQSLQQPVNNFINTQQQTQKDMIEWRILNENEEVDNLYVQNKTLFINDENMILKGIDGSLEKWKVKKVYPIDKKDEKISQLEEEIKQLKEMINSEHSITNVANDKCFKSASVSNFDTDTNSKTTSKSVSKQNNARTGGSNCESV